MSLRLFVCLSFTRRCCVKTAKHSITQKMHVVSVRLHYSFLLPDIIWLPWQRPLTNRKMRYRSIICTQSAFIWWKDYENQSSGSWDNCSPGDH